MTAAETPSPAPCTTSRRHAVMAGGLTLVALGGCTTEGSAPPTAGSAPPSSGATASSTAASTDPDRDALDRAVTLSSDLLALVTDAGPALDPGGRLAALHTAHLDALAEATGATASASPSPGPATAPRRQGLERARARLRRQELSAQRELAALAVAAESGAVARLLASMSAGVAARVASNPAQEPR